MIINFIIIYVSLQKIHILKVILGIKRRKYSLVITLILQLKNITNILGSNAEGFEGIAEGKVYYKYKTISEIKKWLDKNY